MHLVRCVVVWRLEAVATSRRGVDIDDFFCLPPLPPPSGCPPPAVRVPPAVELSWRAISRRRRGTGGVRGRRTRPCTGCSSAQLTTLVAIVAVVVAVVDWYLVL